jgi:anti-sigma regulatory factor (Ser/Thr protein kinase)
MVDDHRTVERFPCDDTAPGQARQWVASVLDSWRVYNRRADLLLLLSELVNNAVSHCQSDVEVAVTRPDRVIHVEVFDDAAGQPPMLKAIDPHSEHGRGLYLVDALAGRWGYRDVPPRKAVWFDVPV